MGATLTLETAWELARAWYGDRLDPTWRRRDPDETAALFRRLGLTGGFWELGSGG